MSIFKLYPLEFGLLAIFSEMCEIRVLLLFFSF